MAAISPNDPEAARADRAGHLPGGDDAQASVLAAVERCDHMALEQALKAGADVGIRDFDGGTALHHARARGLTEVAALLEEAGARE